MIPRIDKCIELFHLQYAPHFAINLSIIYTYMLVESCLTHVEIKKHFIFCYDYI